MYKTVAVVNGMSCEMCEAHINNVVRTHFDVKKVKSSRKKKETVILSENPIDEDKLRAAIDETGYTMGAVSSEPYVQEKKGLFGFFK